MSELSVFSGLPATANADLVRQIDQLTVALGESEYHAATILAFDPDAHIAAGQLAGHDEPYDRRLAGDAVSLRSWAMLARACCADGDRLDDAACLARFLAARTTPAEPVLEHRIGSRVRIRPRTCVGGDRYAGREGVIVKTHFAGFYVKLDMSRRERSQKTELVETAYLEVLAPPLAA